MPRKIRDIIRDLEQAGFFLVKGQGKGDHRKYRHQDLPGSLILDGKAGADAKPYQEKQLRNAIQQIKP
jgi:predicted RNA binding protein YcfA (HicA-like mRNA interferase family)